MTYWEHVLEEVLNKDNPNYEFRFTNLGEARRKVKRPPRRSRKRKTKKSSTKLYYLGPKYPNIYFGKREAECLLGIMNGDKVAEVAKVLRLSIRTVEYYIKNMKDKIFCRTKKELIKKVRETQFLENIDF